MYLISWNFGCIKDLCIYTIQYFKIYLELLTNNIYATHDMYTPSDIWLKALRIKCDLRYFLHCISRLSVSYGIIGMEQTAFKKRRNENNRGRLNAIQKVGGHYIIFTLSKYLQKYCKGLPLTATCLSPLPGFESWSGYW